MMDTKSTLRDANARLGKLGDEMAHAGRSAWLAGIGMVAEAERQGRDTFETLVRRGETYEARRREDLKERLQRATGRARRVRQWLTGTLEETVEGAARTTGQTLERLGVPTHDDIATLNRRIERLHREVESLHQS
ncbi:MAG: phasin family protein [Acidobacteriota bacterium]|nr:phasin family protein [Acidobacteriota bacterium]